MASDPYPVLYSQIGHVIIDFTDKNNSNNTVNSHMSSSWFVLAIIVGAAAVAMMMTIGIAVDDDDKMMKVEGQTVGSKADPVVVLDGTGKGTATCSNSDNGNNLT